MNKKHCVKFKFKMLIIFLAIIIVPLLFGTIVFFGFGYHENVNMLHELTNRDKMIGAMISRRFMKYLVLTTLFILIVISAVVIAWINKDVYKPLKELSTAMQHIAEGDFDYRLQHASGDEMDLLYEHYEQMRLQLKENEEEKIQNEKKSKELVSNISHDLKTPITSIKGYVEGIMDGVADTPEKMDKYIKTIYNKANDMDRLINELTTYSGIDSNKIPYNFHILNVADYFSDCVEEVGLDLESKNIHLNFTNLAPTETCVVADPEQLKKVINNIIGNSVKYMGHDNGEIDIRILDEGESVKVEIEDNGKGIASKDLGNIFERFYRTDASRNSMQGGSGIGLSIVKKIIEDHGGYVWATSKEGEGTCMHFVLRKHVGKKDEVII
jgi:signal transduction histidine kinase